eukprot:315534-Chlamydomonas_euryale.AAC.2
MQQRILPSKLLKLNERRRTWSVHTIHGALAGAVEAPGRVVRAALRAAPPAAAAAAATGASRSRRHAAARAEPACGRDL